MKFSVGDKIRYKGNCLHIHYKHRGMTGIVTDYRTYGIRLRNKTGEQVPSHYVIKFENYKIPHIYQIWEIDASCELVNRKE